MMHPNTHGKMRVSVGLNELRVKWEICIGYKMRNLHFE